MTSRTILMISEGLRSLAVAQPWPGGIGRYSRLGQVPRRWRRRWSWHRFGPEGNLSWQDTVAVRCRCNTDAKTGDLIWQKRYAGGYCWDMQLAPDNTTYVITTARAAYQRSVSDSLKSGASNNPYRFQATARWFRFRGMMTLNGDSDNRGRQVEKSRPKTFTSALGILAP